MEDKIKDTFNKNKSNTVDNITLIENINSKVDKELSDIFERNNFISKIIMIK
ncbi:hypothetical protein [Methanosphaera sp.]